MSKFTTDYYHIPASEASELIEAYGSVETVLDRSIDICREKARLYCIPANWESTLLEDGRIRVKRQRNKRGQK